MKVWVCYTLVNCEGLNIECIFDSEEKAKKYCEDFYGFCSYDSWEVE